MFNRKYYVPILRGKAGEFEAIKHLDMDIKRGITPLIDIPPVDLDHKTMLPKETLDKYLKKKVEHIKNCWGTKLPLFAQQAQFSIPPIFVDFSEMALESRTPEGNHPLEFTFDLLREKLIVAIPTTGTDRDTDYNKAVANVIKKDDMGVCIRILDDELYNPKLLNIELDEILKSLGVSRDKSHLIIDLKTIEESKVSSLAETIKCFINALPQINDWLTFTIAATGVPESMAGIMRNSEVEVSRLELNLWKLVAQTTDTIDRIPSFGDYGIVSPNQGGFQPGFTASAKIRYTIEDAWLILKGHSLKKTPGREQYYKLTKTLFQNKDFLGKHFSWGDKFIGECAQKESISGQLQKWVFIDTNHHLTFVSKQFANFYGP